MHASDWIVISSAVTTAIAVVLSYLSYRRTQDVRRAEVYAQRTAQARLITAWWTRVDERNQDVKSINATSTTWIEETGYRIWLNNSSDDAVYDCIISADMRLSEEYAANLQGQSIVALPYMTMVENQPVIGVGTLPPKERFSFELDGTLIRSLDTITIGFRDAGGVDWKRTAGKLKERRPGDETVQSKQLLQRAQRWLFRLGPLVQRVRHSSDPSSTQDSGEARATQPP